MAIAVLFSPALVATWIILFSHAEPPALVADAGRVPQPEYAVTWVPGIGPRTYGPCTRILSIDGGGVRGLVPALVLAEIEQRTGRPVARDFDLVVGTSTGAILALGLTRPSNEDARQPAFSASDLVDLYRNHAGEIFPQTLGFLRAVRRIFRPSYSPEDIERVFSSYFEDVALREALTNVAVPGYDIEDGRRLWFLSHSHAHGLIKMADLVRGATAAPTYLPPVRFAVQRHVSPKGYVTLVDGALFANNPAQAALSFGAGIRGREETSVLLLSIGTGTFARKRTFDDAWGWGVLGWMDPLLEIAFSDPAVDHELSHSLEGKGSYFRLQPPLGTAPVRLDDSSPEALRRMETVTQAYIQEQDGTLKALVAELGLPRSPQCPSHPIGADYERPDGPRRRSTP